MVYGSWLLTPNLMLVLVPHDNWKRVAVGLASQLNGFSLLSLKSDVSIGDVYFFWSNSVKF